MKRLPPLHLGLVVHQTRALQPVSPIRQEAEKRGEE
jgi:hypothetical protein